MEEKIIQRELYSELVENSLGKGQIVVLTGQRRVGKSYLLKSIKIDKESDTRNNVIYIDKEKREFDFISTYRELNDYIARQHNPSKHNFILIDEVQDIESFEKSVRSWRTEPHTDVIITGSNAHILSGDLTTLIGGRYRRIYILPLSYLDFLQFHNLTDGDDALATYLNFGGLPGLIRFGLNDSGVRQYQLDVYNTALLKDVIMRNDIRNAVFLENLSKFIADNIGKPISANSISKYMKSQGEKVTPTAVGNYLKYLSDAYVMHYVNRFDIHGKLLLETNGKFYFEDHGIRNALVGGSRQGDIEKLIENVIYLHLLRLGYTVNVGHLMAGEVDFVCTHPENDNRIYIQASYLIASEETYKREFGTLHRINDNYPKYVISMTPLVTKNDDNGITHLSLRHFLTKGL